MYQCMHFQPCRVPKKTTKTKTSTTICYSTSKQQFTEDLFAASHHSCSPEWLLGRPSLKEHEPSCSFILLSHVWQNRSNNTNFCFLITCSVFSDSEGEKTSAKSMCCYTDTSINKAEAKLTTASAHSKTSGGRMSSSFRGRYPFLAILRVAADDQKGLTQHRRWGAAAVPCIAS